MKDVFNLPLVSKLADHLLMQSKLRNLQFDGDDFIKIIEKDFQQLELKARSHRIFSALTQCLSHNSYHQNIELLQSTLTPVADNQDLTDITTDDDGVAGWLVMPLAEYVAQHAILNEERLPKALNSLKEMTRRFTAEFAIRHLLLVYPEGCLVTLDTWLGSPCHHVRRLVSEGTRPKLPWASQLPLFIEQPNMVLPLLEKLKNDESEYVRRSVANHVNDISKDHPELTVKVLKKWASESDENNRKRLIKHAGRTLIKSGSVGMLSVIGYTPIDESIQVSICLDQAQYQMGEQAQLSLTVVNNGHKGKDLLVDYCVYHLRGRGQHIKKVFKWKTLELAAGKTIELTKLHGFKPINTRRYYNGEHFISVIVNGQEHAKLAFDLAV